MNGELRPIKLGDRPDVLFLIGCWTGESKRYRVYNLVDALTARGIDCRVHDYFQARDILALDVVPRVTVFFRAPFDPSASVIELLEHFRRHRVRTVFDVDDLVFEPAAMSQIAGISHFTPQQRFDYERDVRAYRAMMFSCDHATASTDFLVSKMTALGRSASLISNSFNPSQLDVADRLIADPVTEHEGIVRICYYSGSKTHQVDFEACATALRTLMAQDDRIVFRLVGLLDLDEAWLPFADRIDRSGFMDPLDMLADLQRCDINLAPLEEGNDFCEGKSELKFFEAALVEVPTIASRTITYSAVIEDGANGLLASSNTEWLEKLELLVASCDERRAVGRRARETALRQFHSDAAARQALRAYGLEDRDQSARPQRDDALKIGWILPGIIIGGGGHRNILRAAFHLEQFGHDVRLYVSGTTLDSAALRQQVRRHFYPFRGPVSPFEGHVDQEDVLIATHWTTVGPAESVRNDVGHLMYFVQDFEPAFYPMGSEYLLAEDTYRHGHYGICSGPWCARLLKERYAMPADFFRFPIDRQVYSVKYTEAPRLNRIVFFAKPDMPRRCYAIGAEALGIVKSMRPEVEIVFFGSNDQSPVPYPVHRKGVLPTLENLADLYSTARLGIVFSTTNPSLVPYEMMACGLPVVDLDMPGAEVNYGDCPDIAFLVDPSPQRMAEQIVALLDDDDGLAARAQRGLDFVADLPTEEQMARRVEALVLARVSTENTENDMSVARVRIALSA